MRSCLFLIALGSFTAAAQTQWVIPVDSQPLQIQWNPACSCQSWIPLPGMDGRAATLMMTTAPAGESVQASLEINPTAGSKATLQLTFWSDIGRPLPTPPARSPAVAHTGEWQVLSLSARVPDGALLMEVSLLVENSEVLVRPNSFRVQPSRFRQYGGDARARMNRTALNNLMDLARLCHALRLNYPAEHAAAVDWLGILVDAVSTLDYATQPSSLGRRMQNLFSSLIPTLRLYTGAEPPLPRLSPPVTPQDFTYVELNRGLKARVPRTPRLYPSEKPVSARSGFAFTTDRRSDRLAALIYIWSLLQPASQLAPDDLTRFEALARALTDVATEPDVTFFFESFYRMAEKLSPTPTRIQLTPEIQLKWPR